MPKKQSHVSLPAEVQVRQDWLDATEAKQRAGIRSQKAQAKVDEALASLKAFYDTASLVRDSEVGPIARRLRDAHNNLDVAHMALRTANHNVKTAWDAYELFIDPEDPPIVIEADPKPAGKPAPWKAPKIEAPFPEAAAAKRSRRGRKQDEEPNLAL